MGSFPREEMALKRLSLWENVLGSNKNVILDILKVESDVVFSLSDALLVSPVTVENLEAFVDETYSRISQITPIVHCHKTPSINHSEEIASPVYPASKTICFD